MRVRVSALALEQAKVIGLLIDVMDTVLEHLVFILAAPASAPINHWKAEVAAALKRVGAAKVKATNRHLEEQDFLGVVEDHLTAEVVRKTLAKLRRKGYEPLTTDAEALARQLWAILRDWARACARGQLKPEYVRRYLDEVRPVRKGAPLQALLNEWADRFYEHLVNWEPDRAREALERMRRLTADRDRLRRALLRATRDERLVADLLRHWDNLDRFFEKL